MIFVNMQYVCIITFYVRGCSSGKEKYEFERNVTAKLIQLTFFHLPIYVHNANTYCSLCENIIAFIVT